MNRHLAAAMASLLLAAAGLAHADTAGAPMQRGETFTVGVPRGGDPVIFDSFTGAPTLTTTGGLPRTFIGGVADFVAPVTGPEVDVTGLTVFVASTAEQTFSNGLLIRVQFWDTYDSANATAIFSNPVGAIQTAAVAGPVTLAVNTFTQIDITLAAPLRLSTLTGKGFVINIQGDNGAGPVSTDTLTTLLAAEAEPGTYPALAVGQNGVAPFPPDGGFYRNVANQTNFNHASGDRRTFTGLDNIRAAVILRGVGGVPVTLQSFDVE